MSIHNVIPDIGKRLRESRPIKKENREAFLAGMSNVLSTYLEEDRKGSKNIRMSNIGKQDRKIWMDVNGPDIKEELTTSNRMRFLYGSIVEELLLFLVKESGHEVTAEQKKVTIDGVDGHMDCKIDGEVVDIKSASPHGFKKFKTGFDQTQDEFGYIGQISGYVEAEGKDKGYFLAMNKSDGDLALLEIEDFDLISAKKRIKHIREFLSDKENPPKYCALPVPEGKSGNMKLARVCFYCEYKNTCWPKLRAFQYSDKVVYLTKVSKEPNVEEIHV
tara:strand:+ start:4513 stop:5337 length:825 start_codon:yes stop_codon:yes gene_type:complete